MSRRHVETLTDYLVVAISPALIIFMVGSLAFFLQQLFYRGNFDGRLQFATGLFVTAAVLISRISIEEGREYASAFALPLSIVTILSMMKYTDLSLLFVVPLIVFIWWSTDKLTWDSTVIDDKKDSSGEGLLQTVGLEGDEQELQVDRDATTDAKKAEQLSLWQRWLARRRRHHTPGVWVIYFGIAAIPLFGLGQLLLPDRMNGPSFLLLCIYVASALALLMTTSFLQMRRYLIQRRLPFTDQMAATWLGTGGLIIVGLLTFCLLLPRPNTGYSIVDSISGDSSRDRKASRFAFGKEGVVDEQQQGGGESDEDRAESDSEAGRQQSEDAQSGSKPGDKGSKSGSKGKDQKQRGQESRDGQDGDKSNGDESDSDSDYDRSSESKPESNSKRDREQSDNDPNSEQRSSDEDRESSDGEEQGDEGDGEQDDSDSNSKSGVKPNTPQKPSSSNPLQNLSLPSIPKLVYFAIIGLGVLFVMIKYGKEIGAAISAFIRDLRAMIARLFGAKPRPASEEEDDEEVVEPMEAMRPFSSYQDPFAMGTDGRYSPQQLVVYTFEALQAWANERNCGREAKQTPLEFAAQIGGQDKRVGPFARNLAMLYNQAAYAPGTLGVESIEHVKGLWGVLRG